VHREHNAWNLQKIIKPLNLSRNSQKQCVGRHCGLLGTVV